MRLTGRVQKYFEGLDSRAVMSVDPYAIIDMCAALDIRDEDWANRIEYHVRWMLTTVHPDAVDQVYHGFERPAWELVERYITGKQLIAGDTIRSTYTRKWDAYADDYIVVMVTEHDHDGFGAQGTEYSIDVYPRKSYEAWAGKIE